MRENAGDAHPCWHQAATCTAPASSDATFKTSESASRGNVRSKLSSISSSVIPSARHSRIRATERRVPRMASVPQMNFVGHGFARIFADFRGTHCPPCQGHLFDRPDTRLLCSENAFHLSTQRVPGRPFRPRSVLLRISTTSLPQCRSSGRMPVRLATRASIRGPISSLSWNAKTKSGKPSRASVLCEPDCLLTVQPRRSRADSNRLAWILGQWVMRL